MITIVVADDEKLIRAGIKKILLENLGSDINILEAKNGNEALEICQKEQPYVIITDIRMPGMDGVELMKKVSDLREKPAIIVLSGFDDFTYAKSAIASGAVAYILKPVDTKELIGAVNKALNSAKNEEKQENEQKLRSIISDGTIKNGVKLNKEDFKSGYCCVSVNGILGSQFESLFENLNPCYVLDQKKEYASILVSKDEVQKIKQNKKFLSYVVGISETAKSLSDLRKLCYQSISSMLQSFFEKSEKDAKVKGFYEFTADSYISDFSEIDTKWDKVIASLDLLSTEDIKKNLGILLNFSEFQKQKRGEVLHYIYEKVVNNLFKRYPKLNDSDSYLYLKGLMIENIDQSESLAEWKRYMLDYFLYLAEVLKQQQGRYPYITKAISYISSHYSEDITMATVANYVSMNYTWFSEKFKEQVGVNFNDYLKKFRMEQAKHLLEMGTYKVYEVAAKCGFKDVKHFMKSFREMNGMSAGEWARTHGNILGE